MQAHSNAAEYMPMALLLLAVMEVQSFAPAILVHATGARLPTQRLASLMHLLARMVCATGTH